MITERELRAWLAEQPSEQVDAFRQLSAVALTRFGGEFVIQLFSNPLATTKVAEASGGDLTRAEAQDFIERQTASIMVEDRINGAIAALAAMRLLVGAVGGLG